MKKRRTYTRRLVEKVVKEVLERDVVNAGERNRITTAEIDTILKELEADCLEEKPRELKKLGIDEITQLKGGKNYAAVLVDLEKRKPIALLEKRNKEVIAEYLQGLGSEILNQIEEVSIDLWRPIVNIHYSRKKRCDPADFYLRLRLRSSTRRVCSGMGAKE